MNAPRFDGLTRQLTTGFPRRTMLAMVAGALTIVLAGRGREAEAGCKKVNKKCDKNNDCCDGAKCKKDKCACKAGRQECGGKCYHLDRDENHCGACDIQCDNAEGEICSSGNCVNVPS